MKSIEELEQLARDKSFNELSAQEKAWVLSYFESEEEYEAFRVTEARLNEFGRLKADISPDKRIFSEIKRELRYRKNSTVELNWLLKPIPAYVVIIFILMAGFISWWAIPSTEKIVYVDRIKSISVRDTIFLAAKTDTVITEKIVYVKVKSSNPQEEKSAPLPLTSTKGVNMKEKEELEGLLVSGSR